MVTCGSMGGAHRGNTWAAESPSDYVQGYGVRSTVLILHTIRNALLLDIKAKGKTCG